MNKIKKILMSALMVGSAIAIVVAAIMFEQSFWRISPLFVSLIIALLQSKANRYHALIGGINAILYFVVYLYYGLYGMAFYALFVSCPIQIITFVMWNRNSWKETTVFRKMSIKYRFFICVAFIMALALIQYVLKQFSSDYALLDSTITLLGILTSFLTMFAFVEYTWLMIIYGVINIVLYVVMLKESPEQATYLIFSVYSFICQVIGFFKVRKIYKQQQ